MRQTPKIVDRWRMDGSWQPIVAQDARMYGFLVGAQPQPLVDRYLNQPAQGAVTYATLLPAVLITFTQIARLAAAGPPFKNAGCAGETEATIWVILRHADGVKPLMFAPYIFVDLPWAIAQGREIYGFPKEIGRFPEPSAAEWRGNPADVQPTAFSVEVFGTRAFSAATPFAMTELLSLRRVDGGAGRPSGLWEKIEHAAEHLEQEILRLDGVRDIVGNGLPFGGQWPPIGTVAQLKQIYDAADGADACHQSIVETNIDLKGFGGGWWLDGRWDLHVRPLASHPLHVDFGWEPGCTVFPCLFAYWMDFSFQLGVGRTVWCAEEGG